MTAKPIKVSKALERELERTNAQRIVVTAVLNVNHGDLDQYCKLGLIWDEVRITSGPPVLPPPSLGIFARRKLDGWSDKRTDLSKETREVSNWECGARFSFYKTPAPAQLITAALRPFRSKADSPLTTRLRTFADALSYPSRVLSKNY